MPSRPRPSIASTPFSAMFHTTWVIWSASNGNDGTAGSTRTESSTSCARPGSSRIRAADVIDDLADVAREPLGLARPGEDEEVREDAVEPPRLLLHDAQRVGALLAGEGFLARRGASSR